jgi:hypothetical protein
MIRPLADIVYAAASNPVKLLDCAPDNNGKKHIGGLLKVKLREARRYYVDEEVTRATTRLGVQHPDILKSMLSRARLPFAKCWVEWDIRAMLDEIDQTTDPDCPERAGCLIERLDDHRPLYRLTCIGVVGPDTIQCSASPLSIIYDLDTPLTDSIYARQEHQVAEISGLPVDYLRKSIVGAAYITKNSADTEEQAHRRAICDALTTHAYISFSPFHTPKVNPDGSFGRLNRMQTGLLFRNDVVEQAGTWRFVVSLFALINSRDYVDSSSSHRQGKSRLVSGTMLPYMDHWLVRLRVPRKVVEARLIKEFADAIPRRLHEVSGHWKMRKPTGVQVTCDHAYVEETPSRLVCAVPGCGHLKWWTNNFMRGDARVGIILKDRVVTK